MEENERKSWPEDVNVNCHWISGERKISDDKSRVARISTSLSNTSFESRKIKR